MYIEDVRRLFGPQYRSLRLRGWQLGGTGRALTGWPSAADSISERAGFKLGSRQDEVERERERLASRRLSVFPDDEGMYVVKGRLTPEQGALLMRASVAPRPSVTRWCCT